MRCAAHLCQLVLAEVVEKNLLFHAAKRLESGAAELIESCRKLIELMHPEPVKYPLAALVRANRHWIRHEADSPVLL